MNTLSGNVRLVLAGTYIYIYMYVCVCVCVCVCNWLGVISMVITNL